MEQFVETFLYFFEKGSNAEYVSLDKNLFFLFYNKLYAEESTIKINEEIGGHSPVWAKRAQVENCRAYMTPQPSDYNLKELRLLD